MSFRLRLILAFSALALAQALLFTALSDQLIRDGLEGEASERLAMIGTLLPFAAPARDWPLQAPSPAAQAAWRASLAAYAQRYDLSRATLLLGAQALDSRVEAAPDAATWWQADGLRVPLAQGMLKVSGPLYQADDGWHKVLYVRLAPKASAWLRLEAGTPFLGQVAAVQKRMWRLSATLVLPALLAGLLLAWALSRRARALAERLKAPEYGVRLGGRDEFADISAQAQELYDSLKHEKAQGERLSEAKLRQARDLAQGVAHELRNPLAGLSLMADLFERRRKEGAPDAELTDISARLQAEVGRVEATVARFLEFSRAPDLVYERLELLPLLKEVTEGMHPAPTLSGDAWAWADKKAVFTIFGVLFANAREASGKSGHISAQLSGASGTGQAILRVWDDGPAVPADDRARIFSPFFTTKPKGLGLGLATASSLADHLGGRLVLLEDGKTFELHLPEASVDREE